MSKILVCYYSENGEVFYDSFSNKLKDLGNEVLQWNTCNYIKGAWGDTCTLIDQSIEIEINDFKADIIFSFNNAFPSELVPYTSGKICLLDADNPQYFWNKNFIENNIDKFIFLGFKKCSKEFYENYFKKEIKKYFYFPAATFIQPKTKIIDKNISFIGGNFLYLSYMFYAYNFDELREISRFFYKKIKQNYFITYEEVIPSYTKEFPLDNRDQTIKENIFKYIQFNLIPGQVRTQNLSVLSDLGLKLYGNKLWDETFPFDADLAICFDDMPVISLEDNENIYNSSKIAINVSHPQANTCFSWRVMDIMASNACLMTENAQDFLDLFGEYLSPEVKESIIYKDRYDLRNKCIKLLEDENLRLKCVAECQNAIKNNGRWEHRFENLQRELNTTLQNQTAGSLIVKRKIQNLYGDKNKSKKHKEIFHIKSKLFKKIQFKFYLEKEVE